jgi:hypothetical protein
MLNAKVVCTSAILLAHIGCMEGRPKPEAPEVAMKHFNDQLANHCPAHKYDPARFNAFAKKYYIDADTQSQQLIDLDTQKSCSANGTQPECYNTGFITAEIQAGGLDEIVNATCHLD